MKRDVLILVAALALGCRTSCRSSPVSYQPMIVCFEHPPAQVRAGSNRATILPRMRDGRLEALSLWSAWWPALGNFEVRPTTIMIADAEDNAFLGEEHLAPELLEGVPKDPVPRGPATNHDLHKVFGDMDAVLPDFAAGHQPTDPARVQARERLRTSYLGTISKEHEPVYRRVSPAWFAFLEGDARFAEEVAR